MIVFHRMSQSTIIQYPSNILRNISQAIKKEEIPKVIKIIPDMIRILEKYNGIGLAAVQIGILQQLAIVKTKDGIITLINPKIIKKSWKKMVEEEGCLSIPEVYGLVKRPNKITVATINAEGKRVTFQAKGLFARIIQHEVDHLNGVLFIDKAEKITMGEDILMEKSK